MMGNKVHKERDVLQGPEHHVNIQLRGDTRAKHTAVSQHGGGKKKQVGNSADFLRHNQHSSTSQRATTCYHTHKASVV